MSDFVDTYAHAPSPRVALERALDQANQNVKYKEGELAQKRRDQERAAERVLEAERSLNAEIARYKEIESALAVFDPPETGDAA